ncbi:MAG: tetratricopeptide repeat protein [Gemmatimonadaceae bacterium]
MRAARFSAALLLCLAWLVPAGCDGQAAGDPATRLAQASIALRTGKYEQAITAFESLANAHGASVEAQRGLVEALSEVGRYDDAETAARRYVSDGGPRSVELQHVFGEVLYARGKHAEAEQAWAKAVSGGASDSLTAQINLALLLLHRGDRAGAMRRFDRFIDIYNERGPRLTSRELTAVAIACQHLGRDDPQLFKDALNAFDAAIERDSADLEPRIALGELFLEKYNGADARSSFEEVLRINPRHPRALVGMARLLQFDGAPGADSLVRQSLATNPSFVPGRVMLAMLQPDLEDYRQAAAEAERALQVDPTSLEALSALAAARLLQGDRAAFDDVRRRVEERSPRHAELYTTLAEVSARNRLYKQASEFARQATQLDPKEWRAFGLLGMNQLRAGQFDEARRNLETAFAGDPYDVWTKNTLDLLDTFKDYRESRSRRFQFLVDGKESELLSLYLGELGEEAYDRLSERYGYRPPPPIRLEVYRTHADFSVRTVGLAGLGALGVSFGTVLAMDSPSARDVGDFNWGSVLWHEIAHTFTLGVTEHRVPRWLSEGISVYEERRARPGWGADATPAFLAAYAQGKLVPVSRLNDGFMRPAYPEQVIFSYYQASLVCELIERDFGAAALGKMLEGYRNRLATPQVFQRALGVDLTSFERRFDAYLKERFAGPVAALRLDKGEPRPASSGDLARRARDDQGDFFAQLAYGRELLSQGNPAEAVAYLERAKKLFPEYAGEESPYWHLAMIHKAAGNARAAASELVTLTSINENNYPANVELAALLHSLGDSAGAAAALERAIYISPYEVTVHARLAELSAGLGDRARAVRERRAVVALNPVDRADALYQLALAYHQAGDTGSARREVLRALELAPNFEKAQELLLSLQEAAGRPAARGQP